LLIVANSATVHHPSVKNSLFAAQVVKDAVVDMIPDSGRDRPSTLKRFQQQRELAACRLIQLTWTAIFQVWTSIYFGLKIKMQVR
jgi:hypothetical protein